MSSILKALKKIDDAPPEVDNDHPWPHSGEARDAITRNIKRRWLIRRLTTYILVAVCLISLGGLFYLRQNERSAQMQVAATEMSAAEKKGQVHRAKIERTPPQNNQSNADVTRRERAVTRPEPKARSVAPAKKTPPLIRRTTPKTTTNGDRRPPPVPIPRKPLPKKSKKAATKITMPSAGESGRTAPAAAPAKRSIAASRSKKSPQYDQLQDTDLILQAIAWSPEPAGRIAVINGSIVREGENVGGYTLMRIRPDDIVLNDGGKTWQLNFPLNR